MNDKSHNIMHIDSPVINYPKSLREVIREDFKSISEDLPIAGGWGYTKDAAIIIDKNDPVVRRNFPFDYVGLEYLIVEKRIFEELIIFRPKGCQFFNIRWECLESSLKYDNGRSFDYLIFNVVANFEKDPDNLYSFKAVYWFDITSCLNMSSV